MDVKKKLMLWLAVFALALPLVLAGTASAKHVGDGSKPNGTTGGWDITDFGKCVSGVDSAGNLVIDTAHNLSRADCIDHTLTTYTTAATCTATTASPGTTRTTDDVSHYWVSVCVDAAGNGVNLNDLDRTAANCILKGGVGLQNACTGAWVYTGPANDGAPGFCYTTINVTSSLPTPTQTECPTNIVGYAWTSSQCRYSYGIAGYLPAAVTKKDGSAVVALGSFVDLSGYTQGQCILNGFSWSTGVTKSGTVPVATTPLGSTAAVAESSRAGCLECHNSVSQNNTYAERWKEPYLKTGHKNMLRKVTAGNILAGPDGVNYEVPGWANGTLNFTTATASATAGTSLFTDLPLMYIFGDWMAAAPGGLDVIVAIDAATARYNGTSTYSCAACHTTGWKNPNAAVGVCSVSSATTAAACATASGTWYPSSGVEGASYDPAEPGASFPSMAQSNGTINGITGKWDIDGITCARCHYTVFAKQGTNAAGTAFAGPAGTGTHNVTPSTTANQQVNNICFGCHQAIAKANDGASANNEMGNPASKIPVKNTAVAPAYVPEFNSHPISNEFLNSPHSRFTGTIVPNVLGKYDLFGNAASQYNSAFKGFVCRSSRSLGGGSILAEVWKNGVPTKIANQADCQLANSTLVGGIPTPTTATGVWQLENQGACTTCHDVHQSLFDPAATEPLKKECETCHEDTAGLGYATAGVPQVDVAAMINHPKISGTPFDQGLFANACEACHMPKATSAGFPMHLWRINPDPAYSMFPAANEFNLSTGATTTKMVANTAPDGAYANAVWVDVDYACGQCHGGSFGAGATKYGAIYIDKTALGNWAKDMHKQAFGAVVHATPSFVWSADAVTSYSVNFNAGASVCPAGETCSYAWDFGDTTTGAGVTASHLYSGATATYNATLTVRTTTDTVGRSIMKTVSPVLVNHAPVAAGLMTGTTSANPAIVTNTGNVVSFTDASSDVDGNILSVSVNWGDGTVDTQATAGGVFTHNYTRASKFTIIHTVRDTGGKSNVMRAYVKIVPPKYVITGTVRVGGTPVSGVYVSLKYNGRSKAGATTTSGSPNFTFPAQLPGVYTMTIYKSGCSFTPPGPITLDAGTLPIDITGTCP